MFPDEMGDDMADDADQLQLTQRLKNGRHPDKALSAAFVRTVNKPGKYFDGQGLFLKVDASGARRWVQRINIKGKRTEMGLGSASLVSLAEARETALENRKAARKGDDPLRAKRETEAALTFEEAARKVYELHRPTWRNPKHAAQFISTLETYVFPRMGKIRVADVGTSDVLAVLTPIWLTKSETARRVRQRIGTVMKWAVAQGWRQDNPADAIAQALPKQDRTQKHRKSLPYDDVKSCIDTVKTSNAATATKLCFELLVLCVSRSGEARMARWEEFDLEKAEWTIPAERMKAKKVHRVPLSHRALEILQEAKTLGDGTGIVFEGSRAGRPLSENTMNKLLRELGYDVDVHGFRTSFKTWCQERTNVSNEVSEAALAHVKRDKAEAAYARSDLFDKRRKLMDEWGSFLTRSENDRVVSLYS